MEKLLRVTGIAAPLVRADIDTDQIIPGKELVRVHTEGYGRSLFAHWRYVNDREPNPEFLLNKEPWCRASILVAGPNFGCGSSREAAPKALREFGFQAIIAPSFGGIFYNNAFRNGIVPVELPMDCVNELIDGIELSRGLEPVTVNLETLAVTGTRQERYPFSVPELLRQMLLKGVDEIDLTLESRPIIEAFRNEDSRKRPWAY